MNEIWTVSKLNRHIKGMLEGEPSLYNMWISGEISNFKKAYSGHCYFSLKDSFSMISCVMFKGKADKVKFDAKDGLKVMIRGNITLYEKGGNYQILVEEMKQEGVGDLYAKFLELKEKLQKKGYFDADRKRPIPFIPRGVGIATSLQGAGLQDMLKIITSRFNTKIFIAPTVVQGLEAPLSIVKSIETLNKIDDVSVIIVGRGGGSFEDLNCFNDERVAKAVYSSKKPIISGVGHETDITICDMTADLRAETPTAAAARVVPNYADLVYTLNQKRERLKRSLSVMAERKKERLKAYSLAKMAKILSNRFNNQRQSLDFMFESLNNRMSHTVKDFKNKLKIAGEKLNAMNPYEVLNRGYSIVQGADGGYIASVKNITKDAVLDIIFKDGEITAKTISEPVIKK